MCNKASSLWLLEPQHVLSRQNCILAPQVVPTLAELVRSFLFSRVSDLVGLCA